MGDWVDVRGGSSSTLDAHLGELPWQVRRRQEQKKEREVQRIRRHAALAANPFDLEVSVQPAPETVLSSTQVEH